MRDVHYFTANGPLCHPAASVGSFSLVARSVTCPACLAALEDRDEEDLRWSARRPGVIARIRLVQTGE